MANFTVMFRLYVDKNPQQSRSRWEDGDLRGIDCVASDRVDRWRWRWTGQCSGGADMVKAFVSGCWVHEHALGSARQPQQLRTSIWAEKGVVWQKRKGSRRSELAGMITSPIFRDPSMCLGLIVCCLLDVNESSLVPPGHSFSASRPSEFITLIDPAAVNTSADVF